MRDGGYGHDIFTNPCIDQSSWNKITTYRRMYDFPMTYDI